MFVQRLRAEFREMPGLRFTAPQVQRLCGVGARECQAALDALVREGVLRVHADGRYAGVSDLTALRPVPARVIDARRRRLRPHA